MDTHLTYNEKKHWDEIKKSGYLGEDLGQGEIDYGIGGRFYALFPAPKNEYCPKIVHNWGYRREEDK